MQPASPWRSPITKMSALPKASARPSSGWRGRNRTRSRPSSLTRAARAACRAPPPMSTHSMPGSPRSRAAASTNVSRFCERPRLPECMTTKGSASPWARAKALSLGRGMMAAQSAQLWITVTRAGSAPFPSTRRSRMVSPTATIRSARATRARPTLSSAASIRRLRKLSMRRVTSGKRSWQTYTKRAPARRAAYRAARPMIGGSVSATTTSGRAARRPATQAEKK